MATIYRKTDKGRAEIDTRAFRLAPRLRSALILVDGKRTSDELAAMLPQQPAETLQALVTDGFIEVLMTTAAPTPRPAAGPPAGAPKAAAAPPKDRDLKTLQRDLVHALNDTVGSMMAEPLALRIEKVLNIEAMPHMLELALQLVADTRGPHTASAFADKFSELQPPASADGPA